MRISIVGPTHPYKGGVAQHTTELAHRLAARGHAVRIESWSAQYPARLYPGRQHVTCPELEPFPATSYPLSWRRPDSWLRLGRRLRRDADGVIVVVVTPVQAPAYLGLLTSLRPVAHAAGTGLRSPDLRSPEKGGRPVALALCHNVLPHERRAVDEPLARAVLRRVTRVLVHTPDEARRARSLTDRPVSVATMAPHLWTVRVPPAPVVIDAAGRPAGGHPPGGADGGGIRGRLLFFGLVRPYKGLDVLLRALAAGPPDVCLTVAGEFWGGVGYIRGLVAELGLDARVDLRPGYVAAADVPALFVAADALVLPYRSGTATQNVDLARLHGVPVVATRVGAITGAVRDGVDGLLAAPDDPASLAAVLRRLYEPGVLDALRAGVVPPDADAAWERYLTAVEDALGTGMPGTGATGMDRPA